MASVEPGGAVEVFDLRVESEQLRAERPYQQHGQSAKTLVKHEHFRLVLISFKSGRRCQEHRAEESVGVQALDGGIRIHLASNGSVELGSGRVLALAPGVAHAFEALEDSTLLLTLAWTGHHHNQSAKDH